MPSDTPKSPAPLALRPRDAARALGIGERLLWQLTSPRGPIACVRVGSCVLYPVPQLQAWLAEQAAATARATRDDVTGGGGA